MKNIPNYIIDIHNWIIDIHNSIMYICNYIMVEDIMVSICTYSRYLWLEGLIAFDFP